MNLPEFRVLTLFIITAYVHGQENTTHSSSFIQSDFGEVTISKRSFKPDDDVTEATTATASSASSLRPGISTNDSDAENVTSTEDDSKEMAKRLMKDLLSRKYYDVGLGDACFARLKEDGHDQELSMFQRYCVCTLSLCIFVGHTLTPEQEQLYADYEEIVDDNIQETSLKRKYSAENLPEIIGISVSYLLIFVIGTTGNILVLVTIVKHMGKPTVTNILIASISAGDLMVLLVVLPYQLVYVLYGFWELGEVFCKIINILYFASFACSSLSLLAMSVERYIVICHPMKAQSVSTTGRAKKIVASVWIVSLLVALPAIPMVTVETNRCGIRGSWFPYTFAYYASMAGVVLVLPTLLMTWAYGCVSVALWRSIRVAQDLKNKKENGTDKKGDKSDQDVSRERIKVIRMLVVLVAVFVVCWAPYWGVRTRRLWWTTGSDWKILYDTTKGLQTLTYLNSAINPILYNFTSRPFRRGFVRACCCHRGKVPATATSATASKTVSSGIAPSTSSLPV